MREKRDRASPAKDSGEGEEGGAFIKKRRTGWAAMIRKLYEADPLRCGLWKGAVLWPPPVVVSRVAEAEPCYDYGYFDGICICDPFMISVLIVPAV
ncbi:MAG: hypothetical protein ACUVWA_06810 [Candidatus Oleimicrobiaceae bacterium]